MLAVWQPVVWAVPLEPQAAGAPQPPWGRLATAALLLFLLGMTLDLLTQAGQASGGQIAAPWNSTVSQLLFATRLGALWLGQLTLGVTLGGLLPPAGTFGPRRRWPAQGWLTLGAAGLLVLALSLASHAAADPHPFVPILADWVHLASASVWVGGLIYFATGLWSLRASALPPNWRARFVARLIPRFSALALTSVALLTLTGAYSAVMRIGSLAALFGSLYGWVLIVKLLIALPMGVLGAVNLLVVTPAMRRLAGGSGGRPSLVGRFRGTVMGEVALGFVLLLSVSLLTTLPPARVTSATAALTGAAQADDVHVNLSITPGRVGVNTFSVQLTAGGQPVVGAKAVELRFTPSQANLPPSQAQLAEQGNGAYGITGAYLGLADTWQVQVVVRREGKFDAFANFNFPVGGAASAGPFPWNRVSGGLLAAVALVYLFTFTRLSHSRRQLLAGLLPPAALALAAVVVFLQPPARTVAGRVNPIPANAASVARGQVLYSANCVPCHGVSGRGDGPVGLPLNPRPADLSAHAVPGVHTDGQLYDWITGGFPGSAMPPFSQSLSDNDRWDLVNFIRTFAPH